MKPWQLPLGHHPLATQLCLPVMSCLQVSYTDQNAPILGKYIWLITCTSPLTVVTLCQVSPNGMTMGECLNRHYVRPKFLPNPWGSGNFCVDLTWNDPSAIQKVSLGKSSLSLSPHALRSKQLLHLVITLLQLLQDIGTHFRRPGPSLRHFHSRVALNGLVLDVSCLPTDRTLAPMQPPVLAAGTQQARSKQFQVGQVWIWVWHYYDCHCHYKEHYTYL